MDLRIVEYETQDGIEYEFFGFDSWEEFELLSEIISTRIKAHTLEKFEGPYSRFAYYEMNGLKFRLMYHSELGNSVSLVQQNKKDNMVLRDLANIVLDFIKTESF